MKCPVSQLLHVRQMKWLDIEIPHVSSNKGARMGSTSCKINEMARDENTSCKLD